jgi:hypothetical protein
VTPTHSLNPGKGEQTRLRLSAKRAPASEGYLPVRLPPVTCAGSRRNVGYLAFASWKFHNLKNADRGHVAARLQDFLTLKLGVATGGQVMGNVGELRALLLTNEESTVASFNAICSELGIEARRSPPAEHIPQHLDEQKYEAVVVDFDSPEASERYLPTLQESRLNRNTVVVAVATNARNLERALSCRAHFVLRRPFEAVELRRTLRAAYDCMLADRRRQFRCSIVLPARLRLVCSGAAFECSTTNISSNGVALYGSMRMKLAETVDLEVVLPDGFVVLATGMVVWDDGHGKSGINFQVRTPEIRQKLDRWLTAQAASLGRGELTCRDFSEILPHTGSKGTTASTESVEPS